MEPAAETRVVPAVDRAARILETLEVSGSPMSISQVARQLGVSLQSVGEVARTFSEIEAALGG